MKDLYHKLMVWIWNVTHPFSLYKKWYGEIKPIKRFEIPEGIASETYMLGLDFPSIKKGQNTKWNKFKCKDGSIYFWKYDDGRIAVKSGLNNIIWLNLQILQFLEAELSNPFMTLAKNGVLDSLTQTKKKGRR